MKEIANNIYLHIVYFRSIIYKSVERLHIDHRINQ